jgi:hypothetical protein
MATRTVKGTLDTFEVDAGSDVTYEGSTAANSRGSNIRGFKVNPGSIGDITVTINKSTGVNSVEIFQEDSHSAGSAPTGYKKFSNIAQAGKGGGAVGLTVTNAAKDYIVLLKLDGYSEVSYTATVEVP